MPIVARLEAEYDVYSDAINNARSGYGPTWSLSPDDEALPLAPLVLRDCGNPLCAQRSYAVYCSVYCHEMLEPEVVGETEEEDEAVATESPTPYYEDALSSTLLGAKAVADAQRARDDAHGLVWLACYGGRRS